jgi:hypothetical protein
MDENRPRSQPVFDKTKTPGPAAAPAAAKGKMPKWAADILGVFFKPSAGNNDRPSGLKAKKDDWNLTALLGAQKIDLRAINQGLAVLLAALIVLTGLVIFRRPKDVSAVTAAVSQITFDDPEETVITPFEQLPFYLDQVKKRDIFNEYKEYVPPPPVAEPPPPPPPPKVTIQEKAKNLKLMGVSWGNDPKAMIMDTGTKETYFLTEGAKIKGTEITIKEIKKEEVIIESDGDKMKML